MRYNEDEKFLLVDRIKLRNFRNEKIPNSSFRDKKVCNTHPQLCCQSDEVHDGKFSRRELKSALPKKHLAVKPQKRVFLC